MNWPRISSRGNLLCFVLLLALQGCARHETQQGQETKPQAQATQAADIKRPPGFGVFYESSDGPVELAKKPTVAAANPSFLVYLEKVESVAKLRLRFVKASASGFVIDAGSVTNSDSAEPKSPPKRDNYQNVFVFAYGEEAGVFEPQVTSLDERTGLFKATYSGTLKTGEYFAFYFVDESKGDKPWAEARFKLAGQFSVK